MTIRVKAKYDYNSGHEDDLAFSVGQIINVTEEVDKEWYSGEYLDANGVSHQGMFPRNFVTVLRTEDAKNIPNHRKVVETRQHEQKGSESRDRDPETPKQESVFEDPGSPVLPKQSIVKDSKPADRTVLSMVTSRKLSLI